MNSTVFLDTGFVVSRVLTHDSLHSKTLELESEVLRRRIRIVTTLAVLCEIGNGLSKQATRQAATGYLNRLQRNPFVEIVPVTAELYAEAFRLYSERGDKSWGMTDCISFTVMNERGITEALAHDLDFEQAGFTALMRQ